MERARASSHLFEKFEVSSVRAPLNSGFVVGIWGAIVTNDDDDELFCETCGEEELLLLLLLIVVVDDEEDWIEMLLLSLALALLCVYEPKSNMALKNWRTVVG